MSRTIEYGYGSRGDWHEGTMQVDDDTTDKEIDKIILNEMLEVFDYTWKEVKDE